LTGAEFGEVDIDLLADYIGGALTGTPEESVVAARVADVPAWRAAHDSLSADMAFVGAELKKFPAEPMPVELATRLDTMFRSAGSETSTPHLALVHDDDAVGDGSPPVREKAAKRAGRRLRFATPIAIAAGVVAFVGFGLDYLAGQNSQKAADSTAGLYAETDTQQPALAGEPITTASGTNYTLGTLGVEPVLPMTTSLRESAKPGKTAPDQVSAQGSAGRLPIGAVLQDCLDAIERANNDGSISVLSVDYARFDGSPALVVRFVAAHGQWAWASGLLCGTPSGGADTLGKVPVR
jgi:hypothetical protein